MSSDFYASSKRVDINTPFYTQFKNRVRKVYMDSAKASNFVDVYMDRKVPTSKLIDKILSKLDNIWYATKFDAVC